MRAARKNKTGVVNANACAHTGDQLGQTIVRHHGSNAVWKVFFDTLKMTKPQMCCSGNKVFPFRGLWAVIVEYPWALNVVCIKKELAAGQSRTVWIKNMAPLLNSSESDPEIKSVCNLKQNLGPADWTALCRKASFWVQVLPVWSFFKCQYFLLRANNQDMLQRSESSFSWSDEAIMHSLLIQLQMPCNSVSHNNLCGNKLNSHFQCLQVPKIFPPKQTFS